MPGSRLARPARLALLALACAASLLSCGESQTGASGPRVVIPEEQEPAGASDGRSASPTQLHTPTAKVALGSGEKLIAVVDVNLNLERTDEQILITKEGSDPRIHVSVVEYDTVLQAYRRTWEDVTSATDERYFSVSTNDVIGDHGLEIICQGTTQDNRLTMDVFRRTISEGTRLSYALIFSTTAVGDIDIVVEQRSQAYLSGDADGKPFAIVVSSPDMESPDSLDIIKTTYRWSTKDKRYLAAGETRIQGETVEREQLQELFSSNSPDKYLAYLKGSWIRRQEGEESQGSGELLRIAPEEQLLQIYSAEGRVEEEYRWDNADAYYRNVTIRNARNTILPDIARSFRFSVESLQEVSVTVQNVIDAADFWKATYRRVSDDALAAQLGAPRAPDVPLQPTGLYQSEDGEQIVFEPPRFTWLTKDRALSGGFYLYRLDKLVLGFLILPGYGAKPEDRAYIATQSSRVEPTRVVATLVLQPARLTVFGAKPISDEVITFVQVTPSRKEPAAGDSSGR